jgi:hypothetical protein
LGASEDILLHIESSIFHWASTSFYSAFFFLNLKLSIIYMMTYGSGSWQAYNALRKPRLLAGFGGTLLFVLQAALTVTLIILLLVYQAQDGRHP